MSASPQHPAKLGAEMFHLFAQRKGVARALAGDLVALAIRLARVAGADLLLAQTLEAFSFVLAHGHPQGGWSNRREGILDLIS